MMKFNMNGVKLQGGVLTYSVDLTSEQVKQLIVKYPELIKVVGSDTPSYFKCNKNDEDFGFTMGRIYKEDITIPRITNCINLNNDRNKPVSIYGHANSDTPSGFTSGFELSTKEEWDKQELLDEAKRRYPIGTVYKHFNSEYTINSPDMLTVSEMDHHFKGNTSFGASIWVNSEAYNGVVYADGEWAETLPLKFTTEDGVGIYGDMKTYLVHPNDNNDITFYHSVWYGGSDRKGSKYFYHKENALAYIEKHKEKTLEDYENMILRTNINSINAREVCWFYNTLKGKEPKLYYTKILQLIADDLNGGWVADFTNNDEKWCISIKDIVHYMNLQIHGLVYFKECEFAEKARALLGDKVNYLFN